MWVYVFAEAARESVRAHKLDERTAKAVRSIIQG